VSFVLTIHFGANRAVNFLSASLAVPASDLCSAESAELMPERFFLRPCYFPYQLPRQDRALVRASFCVRTVFLRRL